jgi:hypothetical protein
MVGFRLTVGKEVATADDTMLVTVVCLVFDLFTANFPPSVNVNDCVWFVVNPAASELLDS